MKKTTGRPSGRGPCRPPSSGAPRGLLAVVVPNEIVAHRAPREVRTRGTAAAHHVVVEAGAVLHAGDALVRPGPHAAADAVRAVLGSVAGDLDLPGRAAARRGAADLRV